MVDGIIIGLLLVLLYLYLHVVTRLWLHCGQAAEDFTATLA